MCMAVSLLFLQNALCLDKKQSLATSHYIMGVMYDDIGDVEGAIEEYKKALRTDDQSSVIHLNLAGSFIKNNNIPAAVEELKLAIKLDPEAVTPHAILAILYVSQNKSELATKEYESALMNASKVQPENVDIYRKLGEIYIHQKKFKEAEGTFRLILKLSPGDPKAHFNLANIYDELKDRKMAEGELKKALELKSDYYEAMNYLGYLYAEENRNLEEAELLIKKALEFEQANGAYLDSLGWVYFKKGKIDDALRDLEKASTLLEDAVIYEHIGDVYLKKNNLQKAKLNWEKSLGLDPKQNKVKEKIQQLRGR